MPWVSARAGPAVVARLVHSADYARLRSTRPWARSEHFAVHHLPVRPHDRRRSTTSDPSETAGIELSTAVEYIGPEAVDKSPDMHWLGFVLPKRLARRAVTRNLLRRQIRAAMSRHATSLPPGLWVVRLRAAFARTAYVSAASDALKRAVRDELDALLRSGAARAAASAAAA